MRITPSPQWRRKAQRAFDAHAQTLDLEESGEKARMNATFLLGLYRQGYAAKQAGKLMAFLVASDRENNLSPFDWFNVGFLECAPYTKG